MHAYEQHATTTSAPWASRRSTSKPPWPMTSPFQVTSVPGSTSSAGSINQSVIKKFTPVEIIDRRSKGFYFKCNEKFVSGHHDACKFLFFIELIDEDDDPTEPTILLGALTGIQPRTSHMMHITVNVGDIALRALLDSGSTHNLIDIGAADHAGVLFHMGTRLCVAVENGDRVTSPGCCSALNINIAGENFVICCYGLSLGSFNVVLCVKWLESLGPVL
jgi:hypothetical protein